MKVLGWLSVVVFASSLYAGCSDSPSQGTGSPTPGTDAAAPQKCDTLISTYCTRLVDCKVVTTTVADCTAQAKGGIACEKAVAVSANYDACMSTLNGAACTDVKIALPDVCKGVILLPQG